MLTIEIFSERSVKNIITMRSPDSCHQMNTPVLRGQAKQSEGRVWFYRDANLLRKRSITNLRTHYIEYFPRSDYRAINESTWLRGLEEFHATEIRSSKKDSEEFDLGVEIRKWVASLPFEDQLEIVALEVRVTEKRFSIERPDFLGKIFNKFFPILGAAKIFLYRHQV